MAASIPILRSVVAQVGSARPGLVANGLGFATGIVLLHLAPTLPPLWPLIAFLSLLVPAAWHLPVLRPLTFAVLGLAWAQVNACRVLCEPFPEQYLRQDLELEGSVASLPQGSAEGETGVRFLFHADHVSRLGKDVAFQGLVRLSWYRDPPSLRAGERWRLKARLKPPHGFANPGGFDYERWLFQQGVRATGSVRASADNRRIADGPGWYLVDRFRQGLRDHIEKVLGDVPVRGLVLALVLGDRGGIAPEQWEVLTRTGTNHLIAISGLHVGLVAAFLFFSVRRAWSLSPRLALSLAAPRAGAVAAFAGALAYSGLAGFAISTQRALIMLAVVLGATLWARVLRPATGLTLALVGVLIVDPKAVLSYGFWLSFGAVAVLLFALGQRLRSTSIWSRWGRAQWAVALGLLPLLLLLFGRASVVAPIANLIAVPLFSLLLLPLVLVTSLMSLVPGLEPVLIWAGRVLDWCFGLLAAASAWPWATTSVSGRPVWVWAAAFGGTLLLLAPRGLPGRWAGLVLLLPLGLVRSPEPAFGTAHFTLLDVGQGLSAVVRTQRHTLVYDVGPAFGSGFNTGDAVVLPFLKEQGVTRIDLVILSHADRDHAGGLAGLADKIPIARVLSGESAELGDAGALACRAGEPWTWDGVTFELLHPVADGLSGNDASCVLRVSTAAASLLLPGDIEKGVEEALAANLGDALRSDILVAAHHGSATSSSPSFLNTVAPRFVLYSAGFANAFGFPTALVRERVSRVGAREAETATAGAIGFRMNSEGLVGPFIHRDLEPRVWSHRKGEAAGTF